MLNNTFPEDIKNALLENALRRISNDELIARVRSKLDDLEKFVKPELLANFERIKLDYQDISPDLISKLIHIIWGEYVDLNMLEKRRIEDIEKSGEKFKKVKELIAVHAWLSGTTTFDYIGIDNQTHRINVVYPFDTFIVNPSEMVGAIYLDDALVPIDSSLEKQIILEFEKYSSGDTELEEILRFVNSLEYKELAIKNGRIR